MRFTERIDEYVLASARERRGAMWFVFAVFALFALALLTAFLAAVASGDLTRLARSFSAPVYLGLLLPMLTVLTCAATGRAPGAWTWWGLLAGGLLIALAPVVILLAGGDWHTPVYTMGRWGRGSTAALGTSAVVVWAVALALALPGGLGAWRQRR